MEGDGGRGVGRRGGCRGEGAEGRGQRKYQLIDKEGKTIMAKTMTMK